MRQIVRRGTAEFFVIGLGVLIALAVDDFRADQADRVTERQLLERLAEDLVADSNDIAQTSGQAAARMAASLRLLTTVDDDDTVRGAVFQTSILDIIEGRRAEVAVRVRQALRRNTP